MKLRCSAARVCHLESHVLIPGLINLHTHAAMTLMRGLADDLKLMDWLSNDIWPVESKHVSGQFVHDGTLLACAEMLRAASLVSTTCTSTQKWPDARRWTRECASRWESSS